MSSRRVMINYGSYIKLRCCNTHNHNRKHYHRNKNHRQSKLRVSYLGIIYEIHGACFGWILPLGQYGRNYELLDHEDKFISLQKVSKVWRLSKKSEDYHEDGGILASKKTSGKVRPEIAWGVLAYLINAIPQPKSQSQWEGLEDHPRLALTGRLPTAE